MARSSVRRLSFATAIVLVAAAIAAATSTATVKQFPVDFDWTPAAPIPGQVVTFMAQPRPPSGVEITGYDWDLDGDPAAEAHGPTARWSYPEPGPVTVRLFVRASGNRWGEATHRLWIQAPPGGGPPPKPPVASFTVAPDAPVTNQPVLFSSSSTDPDGSVTEQVWDLNGDGNYDNGGGTTALRTFADPGEYVVGLRVTDDMGLVSFESRTVTVAPAAPLTSAGSRPRLLTPFPVVRIAGRVTRRGTRVRILRVTAPAGAKVSIRCTGRSCPFKKQVRMVRTSAGSLRGVGVRVRRLERLLRPGVRVRVYVTKRGMIGKYTKFRFRAANPPVRTDACLLPGTWAPVECPAV